MKINSLSRKTGGYEQDVLNQPSDASLVYAILKRLGYSL
jgi:hypothetical protein